MDFTIGARTGQLEKTEDNGQATDVTKLAKPNPACRQKRQGRKRHNLRRNKARSKTPATPKKGGNHHLIKAKFYHPKKKVTEPTEAKAKRGKGKNQTAKL
jgi:hypothetical protein